MKSDARIWYMDGDATKPYGEGGKVIVHCCNNRGGWGSGFVVALSRRWPQPEQHYRDLHPRQGDEYLLGSVGIVSVEPGIAVANLIGQDGMGVGKDGLPPVRYEAIRKGFQRIVKWIADEQNFLRKLSFDPISIHMPRIGCALAGGDWALIEPLIEATFIRARLDVTVYDFDGGVPYFDSRDADSDQFLRKDPGDG